ncbi:MAG: VWA domain-containing protein, partial [Acidobacteriota bacterium]
MKRIVLGVLVSLAAVISVAGNEGENHLRPVGGLSFADEYELTIVNVVVHVTDKQGNPVTGLTPGDFKIFQDGQEKPITNFQMYTKEVYDDFAATPEMVPKVEGETTRPQPRPLSMILYIDNDNLHPLDRNRVLRYARVFVMENLRPPMQMMVVSRQQRMLKVLQPFTSESGPVLDALRKVRTVSG